MHPWHDIYVDDHLIAKAFPVVIEVPMGSKNKYELDKEAGLMRLDRVLYSAVYYPANYGFIPRTFCDDGDYTDHGQLPAHALREIRRFFQDYKTLENKQVIVEDFMGPEDAVKILEEALDMYRRLRRGEISRFK
jgi:inorganic pyrophosphatase